MTRAGVLPRWIGVALMTGAVLVALTQGAPASVGPITAASRALAFAGMGGAALLRSAAVDEAVPSHR